MLKQAVTAVEVLGLDFGFVDVMYNSESGIYMFSESGCNPGMGRLQEDEAITNLTAQVYQQALKHIILNKAQADPNLRISIPTTCVE